MFSLAKRRQNLFADVDGGLNHPYDWKVGVFQYIIGLTIVFVGLVSIEGAALSLVSKLSPVNTRSLIVNVGTTATFLGLAARIMGNFQIVAVDLSHKLINVDIVNSLVVPLLLASLLLRYFIGKKFFFLM